MFICISQDLKYIIEVCIITFNYFAYNSLLNLAFVVKFFVIFTLLVQLQLFTYSGDSLSSFTNVLFKIFEVYDIFEEIISKILESNIM